MNTFSVDNVTSGVFETKINSAEQRLRKITEKFIINLFFTFVFMSCLCWTDVQVLMIFKFCVSTMNGNMNEVRKVINA